MNNSRLLSLFLALIITSCASTDRDTIASLQNVSVEIKDVQIDGGVEKAMQSYQQFLNDTPETAMTPEAIRRLADLKIQKEYDGMDGTRDSQGDQRDALREIKPEKVVGGISQHEMNKTSDSDVM
ncbi:MAG: hypothetical protein OEZ23_09845, partial [Gammaproteobacteria bacterium]|nr:hypothetical protein [Gammaproteobacteria bacterium]